jgi:hypothetical protein
MDLIELGSALGAFFERDSDDRWPGPSHDELDVAASRTKLDRFDPRRESTQIGKMKRIRQILVAATDNDPPAGIAFAKQVIALLRSDGAFTTPRKDGTTPAKVDALRRALDTLGYTIDSTGAIRNKVIDNLTGAAMTDALQSYVRRMNLNPDDPELQLGTAKDLDEATARHVLTERTGSYPVGGQAGSYPVTLANAFTAVGFAVAGQVTLDPDAHRAVQQCLFLLSTAVNRLRNVAGTGHGRPKLGGSAPLTASEARLVSRASALVAGALLDEL